ncbi:hypothetical protein B0T17DRAFT_520562 [Bombardia bombarda]|uniref:N-acetyltransferase domain-containing protein n=1 Tax=Bombardia bombarda TaxID=252184 RepID=A0AA40CFY8_9PEZI|nr:hypothetical protein B0T17DRAFT_520562 [Bombardia bombarda]
MNSLTRKRRASTSPTRDDPISGKIAKIPPLDHTADVAVTRPSPSLEADDDEISAIEVDDEVSATELSDSSSESQHSYGNDGDDDLRGGEDEGGDESWCDEEEEEDGREWDDNEDPMSPSWVKQLNEFIITGKETIVSCTAMLIERDEIRDRFWTEMHDLNSRDGTPSDCAFELFDRYGRLRREYYEHEIRNGTGVWGAELDQGDILLIEEIHVDKDWRRRGLGAKVVKAVLDEARTESFAGFVALVTPGALRDDLDPYSERDDFNADALVQAGIAEVFWRSLGFRRVGTSSWFAFTDDPDHPSRHLDASEDWQDPHPSASQLPIHRVWNFVHGKLMDDDISDSDCLAELQKYMPPYMEDPAWCCPDSVGNTILHYAAIHSRTEVIRYIMSKTPEMLSMRNYDGYTPLEALRGEMEFRRTRTKAYAAKDSYGAWCGTGAESDIFAGYPPSIIESVEVLSGIQVLGAHELSETTPKATENKMISENIHLSDVFMAQRTLQLKYGCTCGECIDGFLSPRMRFALQHQAKTQHDTMSDTIEDMSGVRWLRFSEDKLKYLPSHVQQELEKNELLRRGFVDLFDLVAVCLRQRRVPKESNISLVWREMKGSLPLIESFLERGGTITAVASIVFYCARDQDYLAGNIYSRVDLGDDFNGLPTCRNDLEYGFVSNMCGYNLLNRSLGGI